MDSCRRSKSLVKSRGRQFVGVLCSWIKCQLWHIAGWRRQQKEAVAAHLNTVSVPLMDQTSLSVSIFFFLIKNPSHLLLYPDECCYYFFSREEAACCHNTGVQQNPPSLTKQAPMCLIRADEPLVPVRSLGCLVDHRYCPLHSKCTFSWQTCSVYSTSDVFFSFFSHCLAQDNCS